MIIGIGTDLVEIERMEGLLARYGERLPERILTSAERAQYQTKKHPAQFLASRFAAKEAASKALGTGIKSPFNYQNMEVRREPGGPPHLVFLNDAAPAAQRHAGAEPRSWLSLSDEAGFALAFVVLEVS